MWQAHWLTDRLRGTDWINDWHMDWRIDSLLWLVDTFTFHRNESYFRVTFSSPDCQTSLWNDKLLISPLHSDPYFTDLVQNTNRLALSVSWLADLYSNVLSNFLPFFTSRLKSVTHSLTGFRVLDWRIYDYSFLDWLHSSTLRHSLRVSFILIEKEFVCSSEQCCETDILH